MAWTGNVYVRNNGVFTGPLVWTDDRDAGTKITSAHHDTHDQDIADGITACINKNGANSPTANISWGTFRITDLGAGVATTDAAAFGQTITAAALDPVTNILSLTRVTGGDVTVDLTSLVIGGSTAGFAKLADSQTFTGSNIFTQNIEVGSRITQDSTTTGNSWRLDTPSFALWTLAPNDGGCVFNFFNDAAYGVAGGALTIGGYRVWDQSQLTAAQIAGMLTVASNPVITGTWTFSTSTVFGSNVTSRGQYFVTDASNNGYRIKRVSASAPLTLGMEISGLGTSIGIDLAIGLDSGSNPQAYISGERLWNTDSLQSGLTAAPTGGQNGYLAIVESGADRGLWTKTAGSWVKLIAFP